jgi:hypothetical protein
MTKARLSLAIALSAASGCAPTEPKFGTIFSADFSRYIVVDKTSTTFPCKQGFTVTGRIMIDVYEQHGDTLITEGKMEAVRETDDPISSCRALANTAYVPRDARGFLWGTVSNSSSRMTFDAQSVDSGVTDTFSYVGTPGKDGGTGTLTYTVKSPSTTGQFTIDVTFYKSDVVKFEPAGKG